MTDKTPFTESVTEVWASTEYFVTPSAPAIAAVIESKTKDGLWLRGRAVLSCLSQNLLHLPHIIQNLLLLLRRPSLNLRLILHYRLTSPKPFQGWNNLRCYGALDPPQAGQATPLGTPAE